MQIDRPIAIAVTFFIILLLIFFLAVPEYNTFKQLRTEFGEKKAEFNAEFDYYAAITKTYFDLQSRQDDVQKIDDALPKNADLGNTIYFLQETANENGLIVKNLFLSKSSLIGVNANAGTAGNNIKDIFFSMSLSGDYESLENFIVSLENSSRIFEVTSISFGSESGPPYNFSLQIKTHSY
ncbi:MAG: hypothetical protein NTY81_03865 [Candidatus Staskawiczbacteria bacterium]|nr:hypothetical protein [Candidatus Staskawiczbacteria bacterium]